ncbi:MAG: hypothetical protein ACTHNN_11570 [Xanthobacteraceae bacterium]
MFNKRSPPLLDEWLIKERNNLEKQLAKSENLTTSETIKQKLKDIAAKLNLLRWSMSNELKPPD